MDVVAFVHYNSRNHHGWLEALGEPDGLQIVAGDVTDQRQVRDSLQGCDAVLHLAALVGIPYSYHTPLSYIRTNLEGTYNVLEAARDLEIGQVVATSTSEVYGTAQQVPINEDHPLVGQSPYSASKIAADQLAISYHRAFGLPVKILRPFNTYGPRQSARAIIPTIMAQLLTGEGQVRLGNLDPTRDMTFVRDTVDGFLSLLAHDGLWGEAVNLGTGREVSIGTLAQTIIDLTGADAEIVTDDARVRPEGSEVGRLLSDPGKMSAATGWTARTSLEEGLEETLAWMQENLFRYAGADRYHV
jgi:NAD dependent epimerase/dehydratase